MAKIGQKKANSLICQALPHANPGSAAGGQPTGGDGQNGDDDQPVERAGGGVLVEVA